MVKTLIVEDEAFVALDLQGILQTLGHDVIDICPSAEEGIQEVMNTAPDLILVDVSLAGEMTGVEMVQQLRQEFDMPVIYITAYSDDATILPMKGTEPFEYLLKPFSEQVLRVTIEFALHKATARKEQLASRRLLSTTLQSIGDAVITTDDSGAVQFLNPVAEELTGWSADEAIGNHLDDIFRIINEQTREPAFDPVKEVLETGRASNLANNTLLQSKSGQEYPIEDSAAPIMDEENILYGVVLVFRDITKRRNSELWLRQAQKLDSLGLLASGIAHDFNNILSTITLSVSMLRAQELQSPHMVRLIDRIEHASNHASELTAQLLAYAGGQSINAEIVDLNQIVNSTLDLVTLRQPDAIKINKNLHDGLLPVLAERSQMQQVILNLLLNSFDAMYEQESGNELAIRSQRLFMTEEDLGHYLSKSELEEGEYACLTVTDNGSGIPAAILDKIFDPFFSTKPTGSGLGLAATLGIIYQCNGGIVVDSTIGVGTSFAIILPYQSRGTELIGHVNTTNTTEIAPFAAESAEVGHEQQRSHVLIVDDQLSILDALGDIFTAEGYQTLLASNGKQATELFRENYHNIALVIIDIRMPILNGPDALLAMFQHDPNLKAILMTGHADAAAMQSYHEYLSDVPVIQKPFSYEDILEQVQIVLGKES